MADLIDRQEAIEAVRSYMADSEIEDSDWHANGIAYEIKRLPTADAVEVTRCKECKHCYVDGENVRYNVCDLNHNKVHADDWFCADAEKREE